MRNKLASCIQAAALAVAVVSIGCGGSNKHGGGPPDAGPLNCTASGISCTTDDQCCTGNCDPDLQICTRQPGVCGAADADCQSGPDCCSMACVNNKCSSDQCTGDNQSCSNNGECCSGTCSGAGTCTPLNPDCKTSGNTCKDDTECCSSYCNDKGLCDASPSFCVISGDICTDDFECCGGLCQKASGALVGLCTLAPASGAPSCLAAGEVCGGRYDGSPLPTCGGSCCSRACLPGPTGILICQPASGCRQTGEVCQKDSDCCGAAGNPDGDTVDTHCEKEGDNPIGRCDNGHVCSPAGDVCKLATTSCNATDNCCAGNVQQNPENCQLDNLGIPRCVYQSVDCTNNPPPAGTACASSADCCGNPCTPDSTGQLVCGGTCVDAGGTCTTTSDCCAGLPCNIPSGAGSGTCGDTTGNCSAYGQACDANMPCCNNVPCQGGVCYSGPN